MHASMPTTAALGTVARDLAMFSSFARDMGKPDAGSGISM
jgi:hypothetical protein